MDRKAEGVHATSADFLRYDQVDKKQRYHLAESARGRVRRVVRDPDLRPRTLAPRRARETAARSPASWVRRWRASASRSSRATACPWLSDEANEKVLELYRSTSVEERMRYRAQRHGSVNQGYFPIKETSDIHPDLVEGWVFCRRAFALGETSGYRERGLLAAARASSPSSGACASPRRR